MAFITLVMAVFQLVVPASGLGGGTGVLLGHLNGMEPSLIHKCY